MFWWILGSIFLIVTILCILFYSRVKWDTFYLGMISGILSFIILLMSLVLRIEYNSFERKYSIQKRYYETMLQQSENITKNKDYTYIMNLMDINNELFELQASKEYYGIFTVIPERVLDFKPISIK